MAAARVQHVRIDGTTPQENRLAFVERFQDRGGAQVALLSLTVCGQGLTLTAARTVVFAELHWVPGRLVQAEDRVHRSAASTCTTASPREPSTRLCLPCWKGSSAKTPQSSTGLLGASAWTFEALGRRCVAAATTSRAAMALRRGARPAELGRRAVHSRLHCEGQCRRMCPAALIIVPRHLGPRHRGHRLLTSGSRLCDRKSMTATAKDAGRPDPCGEARPVEVGHRQPQPRSRGRHLRPRR